MKWISAWYRSRLAPNRWCPIDNKRKPRSNTEGLATLPCQSPIAPVSPQHPSSSQISTRNLTQISLILRYIRTISSSILYTNITYYSSLIFPVQTLFVTRSAFLGYFPTFSNISRIHLLVSHLQTSPLAQTRLPYQPPTRLVDLVLNLLFRFLPRFFTLNVHRALSNQPILPLEQGSADLTLSHQALDLLAFVLIPWMSPSLSRLSQIRCLQYPQALHDHPRIGTIDFRGCSSENNDALVLLRTKEPCHISSGTTSSSVLAS